jgi:hypothetical protein
MKHSDKELLKKSKLYTLRNFPLILIAGLFLLTSCEREVNFNLKNEGTKLVVEGAIETGMPPVVRLSNSIGFFSKVDLNTLEDAYVHHASVSVSDGNQTIHLKEYLYSQGGIDLYFYSTDTANSQDLHFLGTPGKTYQLTIQYDGKTYTSQTGIPYPKPLDSLWAVMPPPDEMPKDHPDSRLLYAQYSDPDTPGNRIRYFTKRNNKPFLPALYSVYDDEIINGTTIQIQMSAGFQKMDSLNLETYGYFYKGDTVVVKWCSIDKKVFDFWRTLEYSYGSTGNPFSSPVEVSTNINGGALGVWAGYGATYDTLVISN